MSELNKLLHGEAAEAAAILSGDQPPEGTNAPLALRAALTNALNRIDRIEKQLATVNIIMAPEGPCCPVCFATFPARDVGTTCCECGRGVIE